MRSRSITGKSAEEISSALAECMKDGFRPTLAVALACIRLDRMVLTETLSQAGIAIFGCTTNGSFIDEEIDKENSAIVLLEIKPEYFTILFEEYPQKNYREVAAGLAKKALNSFSNPAFLIAGSNIETDAEQLLLGFEDVIGKKVNIHGCMAGDDFSFTDQLVFTNSRESSRGIVTLVFDEDKIDLRGRALCGWKAVGTVRTVTKSEGNHVYTVDDIPVLELTAKYGGLDLSPQNERVSAEVASRFPLQLQRATGDPVMRPGLAIDWNDHSFFCSGAVPEGSKVRFSLPPDFDVIEKVIRGCEEMKDREMPEADALIIFSCAGRLITLGPLISEEISGLQKIWNVPLVGMFSNAELARANGGNLEMHNLTTCCVVLKEK